MWAVPRPKGQRSFAVLRAGAIGLSAGSVHALTTHYDDFFLSRFRLPLPCDLVAALAAGEGVLALAAVEHVVSADEGKPARRASATARKGT